jgi:putative FmdB family regulatory protein
MPIYVYKCESCGYAKDVLQKMSDAPLTGCPTCGAAAFRKQLTSAGFQLKGSGWYATDFKGAGATDGASGAVDPNVAEPAGAAAKPAASSPTKSEAAPAPVAAPKASAGNGKACACP